MPYLASRTGEPIAKVKAATIAQALTAFIVALIVWLLRERAGLPLDDGAIAALTTFVGSVVVLLVGMFVAWLTPLLPDEIAIVAEDT